MSTTSTLVLLFCIATAIAIVVRRLRVPYTVALVLAGLALGSLTMIEPPRLTRELLFTFFLPGLLFEAAFHLDRREARASWRSVLALAVPGVLIATAVMTVLIVGAGRMLGLSGVLDWRLGLALGAIVAATDPVAVTAVFRDLHAPPRLAALVESESLLNDGTGVVLFSLVVDYLAGGQSGAAVAIAQFVGIAGGGVLTGVLAGWLIAFVIQRLDEPMIEIALTMIAAYGSFVLAESWHVSGVLATVAAGVMCGRHGRDRGMSAASRAAVESFWQYVAFALNSIVFLLLGFAFEPWKFVTLLPMVVVAFVAMVGARAVIVALLMAGQRPTVERMPVSWGVVTVWGGLRGALSMVLAFALPAGFPQRDLIVALTTGVVIASIVLQGATMPWLLRRLGLAAAEPVEPGVAGAG